jgi:hypothetical protein
MVLDLNQKDLEEMDLNGRSSSNTSFINKSTHADALCELSQKRMLPLITIALIVRVACSCPNS